MPVAAGEAADGSADGGELDHSQLDAWIIEHPFEELDSDKVGKA
jgi:hypothetical protein